MKNAPPIFDFTSPTLTGNEGFQSYLKLMALKSREVSLFDKVHADLWVVNTDASNISEQDLLGMVTDFKRLFVSMRDTLALVLGYPSEETIRVQQELMDLEASVFLPYLLMPWVRDHVAAPVMALFETCVMVAEPGVNVMTPFLKSSLEYFGLVWRFYLAIQEYARVYFRFEALRPYSSPQTLVTHNLQLKTLLSDTLLPYAKAL